jgi:hypothetical protein
VLDGLVTLLWLLTRHNGMDPIDFKIKVHLCACHVYNDVLVRLNCYSISRSRRVVVWRDMQMFNNNKLWLSDLKFLCVKQRTQRVHVP